MSSAGSEYCPEAMHLGIGIVEPLERQSEYISFRIREKAQVVYQVCDSPTLSWKKRQSQLQNFGYSSNQAYLQYWLSPASVTLNHPSPYPTSVVASPTFFIYAIPGPWVASLSIHWTGIGHEESHTLWLESITSSEPLVKVCLQVA